MNLVIILLATVSLSWAHAWEKITIPGAKCGKGADYTVFYKKHRNEKLLVEFMGGGACWNRRSCVTIPLTWIYPMIQLPAFSILTADTALTNPFKDHSYLYFPFCTGDTYTGDRISDYAGTKIYHYGYRNIVLALQHLRDQKIIPFEQVNDLIVWGSSAGGIGALTHAKNVEAYIPAAAKKTLIADSPGLHFGPTFWNKFDADAQRDFKWAFNQVALDVDFKDGFVARKMGPVLDAYREWNVGFLYSYRDYTMSRIFGEISPKEHEKLVLSPEGLPAIAKNYPNVSMWLHDSDEHRFLLVKRTSLLKSIHGQTAIDFVRKVHQDGR
jgi:hypothetical protein